MSTIIADCSRLGSVVSLHRQAGNNIHYTAGRLQKRKKGCKLLQVRRALVYRALHECTKGR